jgi:hypothetical protein
MVRLPLSGTRCRAERGGLKKLRSKKKGLTERTKRFILFLLRGRQTKRFVKNAAGSTEQVL